MLTTERNDSKPRVTFTDPLADGKVSRAQLTVTAMVLGASPFSALAADTSEHLASLGIRCVVNTAVVDFLESGSSRYSFYLDSSEIAGEERTCFRTRPALYYDPYGLWTWGEYSFWDGESTLFYPMPSTHFVMVEGDTQWSTFDIEVHRGYYGRLDTDATLSYDIAGTASPNSDYRFNKPAQQAGTTPILPFPAWDMENRLMSFDILDDEMPEDAEEIKVTFHSPVADEGEAFLRPAEEASIVILDEDDHPTRYAEEYQCYDITPPREVWQDGSGIYHLMQDGSASYQISFIGDDNRTQTDLRCLNRSPRNYYSYDGPEFSPAPIIENGAYTPPDSIPHITSITGGNHQILIHFSAEENPIGYTASCIPVNGGEAVVAHAPNSPITITGLSNGIEYACTVAHFNAANASSTVYAAPGANSASPTGISTLGQWGLALLSLLTALMGFLSQRVGSARNGPSPPATRDRGV